MQHNSQFSIEHLPDNLVRCISHLHDRLRNSQFCQQRLICNLLLYIYYLHHVLHSSQFYLWPLSDNLARCISYLYRVQFCLQQYLGRGCMAVSKACIERCWLGNQSDLGIFDPIPDPRSQNYQMESIKSFVCVRVLLFNTTGAF